MEISIHDSSEAPSPAASSRGGRCRLHFRSGSYSVFPPLPLRLLEASQDRCFTAGTGSGDVMVREAGSPRAAGVPGLWKDLGNALLPDLAGGEERTSVMP